MSASVISRATWTNDTGTAAAPNLDGTIINNARLQADVYDKIDAMFAGSGAYATLTFGGKIAVEGFGSHNFDAGGTGTNSIRVRNTSAGTGNSAFFSLGNDASSNLAFLQAFSSTYTTSGRNVASGALLECIGAGGLRFWANHASGLIAFGTGGTSEVMRIHASGAVSIGNTTDNGAGALSVAGRFLSNQGVRLTKTANVTIDGNTALSVTVSDFVLRITSAINTPVLQTIACDVSPIPEGQTFLIVNQTATDVPVTFDSGSGASSIYWSGGSFTILARGSCFARYDNATSRWMLIRA